MLAEEELKKSTELRPLFQWGSTVLTNSGHMEIMRQRCIERQATRDLAVENSRLASLLKEIKMVESAQKKLVTAAKKVERLTIDKKEKPTMCTPFIKRMGI